MFSKHHGARTVSRVLSAFACSVMLAGPALAQTGRVAGTVRDENGQPIKGATVVAENPTVSPNWLTTTTDDRGRFSMTGLEKGAWSFTAAAPGYQTLHGTSDISTLKPNPPIDFRLVRGGPDAPRSALAGVDSRQLEGELAAAQIFFDAKQYDQAIAAFQGVLQKVPQLTLVNLQIGNAYRLKKDYGKAIASYQEVLRSDPANERARVGLGAAYLEAGNLEAADEALGAAAAVPSAGREVFYGLGEVRSAQGRSDEAATCYQRAAELDPTWVKPVLKLGLAAEARNDRESALEFLEKVIALAPDSPEAAEARAAIERVKR